MTREILLEDLPTICVTRIRLKKVVNVIRNLVKLKIKLWTAQHRLTGVIEGYIQGRSALMLNHIIKN